MNKDQVSTSNLEMVILDGGWPSGNVVRASVGDANMHHGNLIKHVKQWETRKAKSTLRNLVVRNMKFFMKELWVINVGI
ncbi:unnamed protein product [Lupinus luteus]|uniref:Uncharacterized protein n=1 Tax=Lupinus luteus TaxID=3873 RepID=A0AAV1XH64_LUPLU